LTVISGNAVLPARSPARPWVRAPAHRSAVAVQDRFALGAARLAICCLPVLLPNGPANLTPADFAIAVSAASTLLWAAYTHARLTVPYRLGVGTMVVAGLLAGLAGRWPGLALLSLIQDFFLLAWAATLASLLRSAAAVDALLRTWVWSGAAWGVAFVVATTPAVTAGPDASRVSFTFGDQNAAGLYFVITLLIMIATGRPRPRVGRLVIGAVLLLATVYTGSLGAISGVLLGAACGLVLGIRDRRGVAAAVAVTASLVLATASITVLVQRSNLIAAAHESSNALIRNSIGREAQSSSERAVLRAESFQLWRSADVLGSGPASTKNLLEAEQAPYAKEAHNDWLATLIERGLLGAAGLLLLTLELVLRGRATAIRHRLTPALRKALARPSYLTGGLACVLAFSLTHEVLHDRTVWSLFGIVAATAFVNRKRTSSERGNLT
jgi:O-antigen ligase